MSRFYVGQKVVCVSSVWPELRVGQVYTVYGIDTCCLTWIALNELGSDGMGEDYCPVCDAKAPGWKHDVYCASFFRPLDSLTEQMERIEKEGAPVEEPQHA